MEAAKKLYHKNDNPFYFKKMSYQNNEQATSTLAQGKIRIKQLIMQAKCEKLN
jgi:hypothetical protein